MSLSNEPLQAMGYQQLTVSTSVVTLTVPAGARVAKMRLEVAANRLRWRDDGQSPSAGTGFLVDSGVPFDYEGDLKNFRAIRADAADAILDISFYV